MASNNSGVVIKKGKQSVKELLTSLRLLVDVEVLVGFPEGTTERDVDTGEPSGITNAALAYIHDNGAPEQNIPARPFMRPAMEDSKIKAADKLGQVLAAVITRAAGPTVVEMGMHQVGLLVKLAIQNKINEGIPPPLADRTLQARARRGRKGAITELANRKQGLPPSTLLAKPLIDTGQMRNAANYVIRSRKQRK